MSTSVAIFTDNDFGKVNGVTTTLRAVLEYAPPDIQARVYTCEDHPVDRPEYLALKARGVGIPFYREMKMYFPPLKKLRRRVQADHVEIVHLTTPGPVGLAALHVAAKLGVPMVGSFHTDLAEYTRLLSGSSRLGALMREYLRWPYGRCDKVLVPSSATKAMLVAGRIPASKISVWKRGVSAERFSPRLRSEALRRRWNAHHRLALLYVGRLSREKGLADLVPLARFLASRCVEHRFIVIGDGPMREELQRDLPDAIFTGTLSQNRVADAMASADIFVFPSRTDTAGNVVLEAQASGLPVLVTGDGGPHENMLHGETGFVCHTVRAFAGRITELAWNPERLAALAHRAREYALTRSWPEALAPLFAAYRELASSAAASDAIGAQPVMVR
jgi:glycosyltransferase involved in cell wall biosynthesis